MCYESLESNLTSKKKNFVVGVLGEGRGIGVQRRAKYEAVRVAAFYYSNIYMLETKRTAKYRRRRSANSNTKEKKKIDNIFLLYVNIYVNHQ